MKILHVITSLQTGGAETLVVNLMPRFRALGHEVGVVVSLDDANRVGDAFEGYKTGTITHTDPTDLTNLLKN